MAACCDKGKWPEALARRTCCCLPYPLPTAIRLPLGLLIAVGLYCLAAIPAAFSPCYPWSSEGLASFYRSPTFNPGSLITYFLTLGVGFWYTTTVVIGDQPFLWWSRRKVVAILFGGFALFWIGPIFHLNISCPAPGSSDDERIRLWEVNSVAWWGIFHILGQHFTYLDYVPGLGGIAFAPAFIRTWGRLQWSVVLGVGGLLTGIGCYQLYLLSLIGRVWQYIVALLLFVVLFAITSTICSRRCNRYTHIHHYQVFLLVPLFPTDHPLSKITQAILIGIAIEGLSRWGPDAWFIKREEEQHSAPAPALPAVAPGAAADAVKDWSGSSGAGKSSAEAVEEGKGEGYQTLTNPIYSCEGSSSSLTSSASVPLVHADSIANSEGR